MKEQPSEFGQRRRLFWWARRIALAAALLLLLLVAATWLAGREATSQLVARYPPPGELVDIGGYRLHLNCQGHGSPTVVMEAGLGDFSLYWTLVQPEVARFSQVCVYDRAGLGWSETGKEPRTSKTMVEELHTLLANGGIEKPLVLVGHSFGGLNARLYANTYPQEVAGTVLVDSMSEKQDLLLPAYGSAGVQLVRQFRVLALLRKVGIIALYPQLIPNPGLPENAFAQYKAILATTSYFEGSNAERLALEDNLRELREAPVSSLGDIPLIVLSRGQDMPVPGLNAASNRQNEAIWRQLQHELAALSSNSQHIIAARSGHNVQLEQPDMVVEAIRQIIDDASSGTGSTTEPTDPVAPALNRPLASPTAVVSATATVEPTSTSTPEPAPSTPLGEAEFTLQTAFDAGRMLYVGVGGDIDGVVNPDLVVPPHTSVRIVLVNGDGIAHDLYLPDFNIQSEAVRKKEQVAEVTFVVSAEQSGSFIYYCTFPGHRESGQEGWLIVSEER